MCLCVHACMLDVCIFSVFVHCKVVSTCTYVCFSDMCTTHTTQQLKGASSWKWGSNPMSLTNNIYVFYLFMK